MKVWIMWGEHIYFDSQGPLDIRNKVMVLREGPLQLWGKWK